MVALTFDLLLEILIVIGSAVAQKASGSSYGNVLMVRC